MNLYDLNNRILGEEYTALVEIQEEILFYQYKDPAYTDQSGPWLNTFKAYRETPEGYWIARSHDFHGNLVNTRSKKWIRKQPNTRSTRKLFAYRTKQDALYSYYRKKLEHLRHLETKHRQIKRIVKDIEHKENFFGVHRPLLTHFIDTITNDYIKPLEPLKKERPKQGFIEESEFAL